MRIGTRKTGHHGKAAARITGPGMAGAVTCAARTTGTVTCVARMEEAVTCVARITGSGTAEAPAVTRETATGQTAEDSIRAGEAMVEMEDRRVTDRMGIREVVGQVLKVARVTAGVRAVARAATAALTVHRAMAEAMADREIDSEIISRAKASRQRLLEKIWRRGARKRRGAQAARRRISAPGKTISMRKTRH